MGPEVWEYAPNLCRSAVQRPALQLVLASKTLALLLACSDAGTAAEAPLPAFCCPLASSALSSWRPYCQEDRTQEAAATVSNLMLFTGCIPISLGKHWHGFLVFKLGIFIIRLFFCRLPFSGTYVSDYRDWRWHVKLQTPKTSLHIIYQIIA